MLTNGTTYAIVDAVDLRQAPHVRASAGELFAITVGTSI